MTVEIHQFWNLLSASNLLQPAKLQQLTSEFGSEQSGSTAKDAAKWLVSQRQLSPFQAKILLAGQSGPFQYGNYTLVDRFDKGQLKGSFKAIHRPSQHPVLLEFFPGQSPEDLASWSKVEQTAESVARRQWPGLLEVHESVALPQHRFIVSELPSGIPLNQKLPRKGRIPLDTAVLLFAQIADALAKLHQAKVFHGFLSPRVIWLENPDLPRLKLTTVCDQSFENPNPEKKDAESKHDYLPPEWSATEYNPDAASDAYGFGCTFYRALTGRCLFPGQTISEKREGHKSNSLPDLEKYELPGPLESMIKELLAKAPTQRRADFHSIASQLVEISGGQQIKASNIRSSESVSLLNYRAELEKFQPGAAATVDQVVDVVSEDLDTAIENVVRSQAVENVSTDHAAKITAATFAAQRRKRDRWKIPAAMAGVLLLMGLMIVFAAYRANQTVIVKAPPAKEVINEIPDPLEGNDETTDAEQGTKPRVNFAELPESERPILFQELIPDDDETLWESPTNGPPVNLAGVPSAPKIIFIFRPSDALDSAEFQRSIQALQPGFYSTLSQWMSYTGLEMTEIEQVIVSLHSTTEFEYETNWIVTPRKPVELADLLDRWKQPQEVRASIDSETPFYTSITEDNLAYFVLQTDEETGSVRRFSMGSVEAIKQVVEQKGLTLLSGSIRQMRDWTDRDRQFNILYLRPALFNDEGQKLMGESLSQFNRQLSILVPDNVRGGLLSFHCEDDGTYFEMMFDRSVDLEPDDLIETLSTGIRNAKNRLTQFVAQIPPSTYWDQVRLRFDNMLADGIRNMRWGTEHGQVTANAWLPPMAAHNLIAATELVMSFSGGTSVVEAPPTGPQTLQELLAEKRENYTRINPPDLNLLMAEIEAEINDEYRQLPFKFRIRLLGGDLEKDGITKNQRPNDLSIQQKSIGEILTEILISANPSKDISGPSDPNCKLVWVIAPDPEFPDETSLIITTRKAAAEKSYDLPKVFQPE